eukprot:TRINITY_DN46076_c0_g1_i1.p1 TRINITY_DN46076_c0_g1~~TRINITY_DN46076_c0_g1_i1.p1  ORF type:complete len:268 (-),score=25.43 TRINITY_DN46076_c0_g1_i1:99-902(-)
MTSIEATVQYLDEDHKPHELKLLAPVGTPLLQDLAKAGAALCNGQARVFLRDVQSDVVHLPSELENSKVYPCRPPSHGRAQQSVQKRPSRSTSKHVYKKPAAKRVGTKQKQQRSMRVASCHKDNGAWRVQKRINGKIVRFAAGIASEAKARTLAKELKRIDTGGLAVKTIEKRLAPCAERLGVKLRKRRGEPTLCYKRRENSSWEVRKCIKGKRRFFACGILSEAKAKRLSNEVKRIDTGGLDFKTIRKRLAPYAKRLGVNLVQSRV